MEKIAASLLATAGIACAQTYNYDSSSETLVRNDRRVDIS